MTELIEAVWCGIRDMPLGGDNTLSRIAMCGNDKINLCNAALTAITDAGYRIVKDEVVAWIYTHPAFGRQLIFDSRSERATSLCGLGYTGTPLYAAPGDEK
jgi:hypothetical protein